MADFATAPLMITAVIWLLVILVLGVICYRKTAGGMRLLAVAMLVSGVFIAVRLILHALRLVYDLGIWVQLAEHIAVVIGFSVLSYASVRLRRISRGGR